MSMDLCHLNQVVELQSNGSGEVHVADVCRDLSCLSFVSFKSEVEISNLNSISTSKVELLTSWEQEAHVDDALGRCPSRSKVAGSGVAHRNGRSCALADGSD